MNEKSIVVFVTDQSDCLRLIRYGKHLADQTNSRLQVISIQNNCQLTAFTTNQLQKLYNCTQKLGGEMNILFSEDTELTAAVSAKKLGAVHLVSGTPSGAFIDGVRLLVPELPWTVVDESSQAVTFPPIPATVGTPN